MWKLRRLLPVGSVELLQVTGNALLNLSHAPLHLGTGEVLVSVVHRLELAAVNRNAGFRQHSTVGADWAYCYPPANFGLSAICASSCARVIA